MNYELIEQMIDNAYPEEHVFHKGKAMVIEYALPNGFTVSGRAGLLDISQFSMNIGRAVCKRNAVVALCQLEAYREACESNGK